MKCPKCHYLSFEPEPRCRNCGFDLALDAGDAKINAPAQADTPPAADLKLHSLDTRPTLREVTVDTIDRAASQPKGSGEDMRKKFLEIETLGPLVISDLDEVAPPDEGEEAIGKAAPPPPAPKPAVSVAPTGDLPLFVVARGTAVPSIDQDDPPIKLSRAPRAPLAVRRTTPAPGRVRERYERRSNRQVGLLERDLLATEPAQELPEPRPMPPPEPPAVTEVVDQSVPAGRRLEAAGLDLLFLGAINLAIVWLTLQRCDLTISQLALLPILPLAAFLFLIDSGYLLMFTVVNGQTVGKMAAHIRVVGAASESATNDRVTLKQALLRALLTFPSVLALGAGFLPALAGNGPAWHDRFAHTRVVRA